jgi:hypothetical protein
MAFLTIPNRCKHFGLICILLANTASAAPLPQKELQIAKDYVLAACIGSQYVGTALDNETDAWAAGGRRQFTG